MSGQMTKPDEQGRGPPTPPNNKLQFLLTGVVSFAWIAVIFLPVPTQVQVGVQAAMMLVLGAIFGTRLLKKPDGQIDDT